jgi:pyruvate,water dikinase
MSWFRKINKDSREREVCRLLNLRVTRFRQLLRNYGSILDRLTDAAEKQAGEYILDRQYIVSLAEITIDLAESIIFDLNVITDNRQCEFYDALKKFNSEIRHILATEPTTENSGDKNDCSKFMPEVSANLLSEAINRSHVLFLKEGQVACRGVAAGTVFNLETAENASEFPDGAIMVAADIHPDDEFIRVMRKAAAILTDFGEPAGDTAILAREFQIPMIVGIEGVSKRLQTGSTITVDADDCIVYSGRLQELVDYYEAETSTSREEAEYRLLRKTRQSLFQLTLPDQTDREARLQDCRSIHDLVHLASELAGDSLVELVLNRRDIMGAYVEIATGFLVPFRVLDVGDGLLPPVSDTDKPDLEKVRSLPLLSFISGLKEVERHGASSLQLDRPESALLATIKEEHANILMLNSGDRDIVDSSIGENKEANHIYCRFASGFDEEENGGKRGAMTREILSRLNFAVAQTPRASSAWISGLPLAETKDRLAILGRLSAFLLMLDVTKGKTKALEAIVEDFMGQYV